jgi:anti-anti-sigma factor
MTNKTISSEPDTATLQPEGDLVAAKLPLLRSRLRAMVDLGVRHLTLDLVLTKMVDSAGIGLLIAAHNSLKKAGGELTVTHASKEILELFRTMRIQQHFNVSGS